MNFIDTDILVIDKLFTNDKRFKDNHRFLHLFEIGDLRGCTSIYNVFELLGIASFNLTELDLRNLLEGFESSFNLKIIYPIITVDSANDFIAKFFDNTFKKICLKMNFTDSVILQIAEENLCTSFITWNIKHFDNRTFLEVQTPKELL